MTGLHVETRRSKSGATVPLTKPKQILINSPLRSGPTRESRSIGSKGFCDKFNATLGRGLRFRQFGLSSRRPQLSARATSGPKGRPHLGRAAVIPQAERSRLRFGCTFWTVSSALGERASPRRINRLSACDRLILLFLAKRSTRSNTVSSSRTATVCDLPVGGRPTGLCRAHSISLAYLWNGLAQVLIGFSTP